MDAISQLMPFFIILGVFYLLVWKPQLDEQKKHEALVASLAKDDAVVLESGVHGRVHNVAESSIELEISKGVRITVDKTKVARRADAPATPSKA